MQKTLTQPGVHVWKSKVSGQYFTAIKVGNTEESARRCIYFVNPEMDKDKVEAIMSKPNLIEGNFIHFNVPGGTEHKIKVGSYLCKNMFGTLINLDADHFESIMTPIADIDKEGALSNYFFVCALISFGTTSSTISFAYKTYEAYPSAQSIKEMCYRVLKEEHSIELADIQCTPMNIQRLTELEFIAYTQKQS